MLSVVLYLDGGATAIVLDGKLVRLFSLRLAALHLAGPNEHDPTGHLADCQGEHQNHTQELAELHL